MRIEAVETKTYRVPLASPWGDLTHRITHIELVISKVTADNGLSGTGFSYSVGVGAKAIEALIDWYLTPRLIGEGVAPRARWTQMWHEAHDAGGGGIATMAIAAIDLALWDLLGKTHQTSLCQLVGKCRESIPVYGSGVNLNLDLQQLDAQVRRWCEAGYGSVKVKVGKPDLSEDVERLALVRTIIGSRPLMIDANQGWDLAIATNAIHAFERFDIHWVEEPLVADDIAAHAQLRHRVRTPIAIGENVYTRYQYRDYLAQGCCDFVQADVIRVGGVTPWLAIAELADTWSIPMAPHFMLEISGQLLCCVPNGAILEDVEGGSFRDLGILAEDVGVSGGKFAPPDRHGHGIVFDESKLKQFELVEKPDQRVERLWNVR